MKMPRLKSLYERMFYRKETYFLLDHLTLKVRDREINKELDLFRKQIIDKIFIVLSFIALIPLLLSCYHQFIVKTGHPFMIVT
jgi:hypothetical protein